MIDPPPQLGKVKVYVLLEKCPRLGPKGVTLVLKAARVWPTTPVSQLTKEERIRIGNALPDRAKR